jgi:hypothetical protein
MMPGLRQDGSQVVVTARPVRATRTAGVEMDGPPVRSKLVRYILTIAVAWTPADLGRPNNPYSSGPLQFRIKLRSCIA